MIYKSVLSIDYKFSVIGMGCRGFGSKEYWDSFSPNDASLTINTAIENGINFFDVSPTYGNGFAETFLGKTLNKEKNRNKVFIATKCGLVPYGKDKIRIDLSRHSILKEIDESLLRLNTDYIDIYQLSWPDPNTDIEETMETLVYLKKIGKIRYIGFTNYSYDQVQRALRVAKVNSIQGYYNIINRNPQNYFHLPLNHLTEKDLFRICYEESIAFFPYSPLFHGFLSDNYERFLKNNNDIRQNDPKIYGEHGKEYLSVIEKLKDFSESINKTLSQVSLNYLAQKPLVTSIIAGVSNKDQLESNLKSLDFKLSTDEIEQIDKIVKEFSLETGEIF